MDVEFFIHGVPGGEGFWGNEEDRNYFGTFYDNSSDEVKFLIQTRTISNKSYCYYNYLVYKTVGAQTPNIVANDGRDGSYFGITLRFDAYCKDIANMYRILDTVYNVYVMGNLLKIEKTKLKYTFSNFANVADALENIKKTTLQLVQKAFYNNSFTSLTGFTTGGGNTPTCNLYDCTSENVQSAVKQYGRIAISPYYPSSKVAAIKQQYDAQIQTLRQQSDAQIQTLRQQNDAQIQTLRQQSDASLSAAKSQVSQLQNETKHKDETIGKLNKEVARLQSEIRSMGQGKNVAQIIAPIKEPIAELSSILKRIVPNNEEDEHKTKSRFSLVKTTKLVVPFLNLMLLIAILCTLFYPSKEIKNDSNNDVWTENVSTTEDMNETVQEEPTSETEEHDVEQDSTTSQELQTQ